MHCHMYTIQEFDVSLRESFILEADPYEDVEGIGTRTYLENLGVFFYRDEYNSDGVILTPNPDVVKYPEYLDPEVPVEEWAGFLAYKISCVLDYKLGDVFEEVEVGEWSNQGSSEVKKYIKKKGDAKTWLLWNKGLVVKSVSSGVIQTV